MSGLDANLDNYDWIGLEEWHRPGIQKGKLQPALHIHDYQGKPLYIDMLSHWSP